MSLINYLTQIQFDAGAVRLVGEECKRLNIARPLIVTDKGVRAAGLLEHVTAHLADGAEASSVIMRRPPRAAPGGRAPSRGYRPRD